MTLHRRTLLAAGTAAVAMPLPLRAQAAFPSRTLRLVVPNAAGGAADITARTVAQKIAGPLGQSVVVENKPSAGGIVAGEQVARAEPDGHTLLLISSGTAVSAALFWGAASYLFSWYVSTLGNYTAAYGSLATVVVFMTWLWLSATIVLAGAELNAELEHQTAHDTTTGRPKPLGQRGATMADRVGPPRAE